MSNALPAPPLLFITDRNSTSRDLLQIVGDALGAGCRWIMVREKDLDRAALTVLSAEIMALAGTFDACITINGNIEAARDAGASGVHLQSADTVTAARTLLGPAALLGVSAHSVGEARDAAAAGADYVTLSPVFLTDSKPGYGPALGLAGLAQVCPAVDCPVIALAGIGPDNAGSCLKAGASGIAVMGGIMRAADPAAAVRALIGAMA